MGPSDQDFGHFTPLPCSSAGFWLQRPEDEGAAPRHASDDVHQRENGWLNGWFPEVREDFCTCIAERRMGTCDCLLSLFLLYLNPAALCSLVRRVKRDCAKRFPPAGTTRSERSLAASWSRCAPLAARRRPTALSGEDRSSRRRCKCPRDRCRPSTSPAPPAGSP